VEDYPFSVTFRILVTKLWELEKRPLSKIGSYTAAIVLHLSDQRCSWHQRAKEVASSPKCPALSLIET
jgi:hypothetical protein